MPNSMPTESLAMRMATAIRLKKLRWSLRRLHCPVDKKALVLEVGAGGNPYTRANVLLDAMEFSIERNEKELVFDRPFVMGLVENLPFRDQSFDFVIASHVLEHTDDPAAFVSELMRVSKAGYIETPEAWFEKMCPFIYHRSNVTCHEGVLIIEKKPSWDPDPISKLHRWKLASNKHYAGFLRKYPDAAHMRFFWSESIEFQILNPECDASWPYPEEASIASIPESNPNRRSLNFRQKYLSVRRRLFSQTKRNRHLDITQLLRCPTCFSHDLLLSTNEMVCSECSTNYAIRNNVPYLFPAGKENLSDERFGH